MSAEQWSITDEAVEWITCPYCEAGFGERCRTSSGRYTTPHSARTEPIAHAFRTGYDEGFSNGTAYGKRVSAPVYTRARS